MSRRLVLLLIFSLGMLTVVASIASASGATGPQVGMIVGLGVSFVAVIFCWADGGFR